MQQFVDVFDISFSGGGPNAEVSRSYEGEQHDEAEEGQCEEDVDAEGADEEDEACNSPIQ